MTSNDSRTEKTSPMDDNTFQRLRYILGGLVTVASFIVYALTVAPTFSYWDCGEFIACSSILGIPHPPGTPLYVLLGRVFAMLPTSPDPAVRINYLSVVSSALAAGVAFFVLFRVIQAGLAAGAEKLEKWQTAVALGGAVSGSLFMAFSATHWNNAVEAEVYGPSMFLILSLAWLAIRWVDRRDTPQANRYLVAISYIALLSLGIHMTVYLALPAIFLFLIAADEGLRRNWRFWVSGLVLFLVAIDLTLFLIGAGAWLILSVILALGRKSAARWGLIAAIMLAGWIGYTSHLFLPIRSAQDPWIDENNPESFESFKSFLERKQYGQTSMIKRMFDRRGTWANQFGDHAHMGFYRYFKEQYGFGGWAMLPVMLLGFYGAFWLYRRAGPWGALIWALFLLGSVGLVLYMNFADGTQYYRLQPDAYMEVRNRDYFFTPGFIVFALMMALGLSAIADRIGRTSSSARKIAVGVAVVAALLPIRTLAENWRGADRSRNYTPYDYAWNLLNSCEPDGVLFTSGDNDTFPVWCIQETYGVRKDVTSVNLSLANTDWYVYQMKHRWGLPVTFTDDQILWTVPDMSTGGLLKRPKQPIDDPISGTRHYLFQTRDNDQIISVNQLIVEHIVLNNRWKRPLYFSSSLRGKTRLELES
ncbi:MAG TPA: DUF2723 domain-containing protein, partial [Acidobacteriota bacterium]|nr:DUF2723 domain-containing protein [Acidobacteriota bacterium]